MAKTHPPSSTASPRTLGAILICLSAVLWGLDGVVLTPRLANLPVPFVVFLLHAIPFALMQPFFFRSYPQVLRVGIWSTLMVRSGKRAWAFSTRMASVSSSALPVW